MPTNAHTGSMNACSCLGLSSSKPPFQRSAATSVIALACTPKPAFCLSAFGQNFSGQGKHSFVNGRPAVQLGIRVWLGISSEWATGPLSGDQSPCARWRAWRGGLISKSSQRLNDGEGVLFQPPDATPKVIRDLIRGGSIVAAEPQGPKRH